MLTPFIVHNVLLHILGYLKDRNAAAHSVDSDILATFRLEYDDDYEYEF